MIDAELVHAQGLLAKGVARAGLYDAIMRDGVRGPGTELSRASIPLPDVAPSLGGGPDVLAIQEFGDHLDLFSKMSDSALRTLVGRRAGKVRLVWRNAPDPKNPDARKAAVAAQNVFEMGGDARFWPLHELLTARAGLPGRIDNETLRRFLGRSVAEAGTLMWLLQSDRSSTVELDITAANRAALRSSAVVVGDVVFDRLPPMRILEQVIDRALAQRAEEKHRRQP